VYVRWDPDAIRPGRGYVISIADEGEFGLIRRVLARLGPVPTPGVLLGPGDDAAVVAAPDGRVVASTDLMVENRHFRRDWSSGHDVGRKAAAANLADIVAMGARPTALLVGLAAPAELELDWVDAFVDGLRAEAAALGAAVVGGDVVAADRVMVAVTALGDLEGRPALTRAGAQPGDLVVVLGSPGRAAAGLALLQAGYDQPLVGAHRRPEPPYDEALALARSGAATAMIDTSDGLLADLGHLAEASGVRVELRSASLAIDAEMRVAADLLGVDPVEWALGGGDDHCFAATVQAGWTGGGTPIGVVRATGEGGAGSVEIGSVVLTDRDPPQLGGHAHFRDTSPS
jgi:thiamine-monophosphate kinase